MHPLFLPTLERVESPDLKYIVCPDCGHNCFISTMILLTDGHLLMIAVCEDCADGRSIKARFRIDMKLWYELAKAGTLVMEVDDGSKE